MNSDRLRTAGGMPGKFSLAPVAQPYYVSVGDAASESLRSNVLHKLCSALNARGCEAYLDSINPSGELWTPVLTEATRVAHYRAGRKPIVVSVDAPGGALKGHGLPVRYGPEKSPTVPEDDKARAGLPVLRYAQDWDAVAPVHTLFVPLLDPAELAGQTPMPLAQRKGIAYFDKEFVAAGGQRRDFGADAQDLAGAVFSSEAAVCAVLREARVFYAFEDTALTDLARLCGCPVVLVPNAFTLKSLPGRLQADNKRGMAWGDTPAEQAWAEETLPAWRANYLQRAQDWERTLQAFIDQTQQAAQALPMDLAWPQAAVDALDIRNLPPKEQGARADRKKYRRTNEQFERWSQYCSIREVDADIYAEHLASGKLPPLSVVIDQRGSSMDALADTLDSLGECLWQAAHVVIVSEQAAPEALDENSGLRWVTVQIGQSLALDGLALGDWVLLVQSGTRLAVQALVEWALATQTFAQAQLIYADDAVWQADGAAQLPHFKPDANIELLRCTNYLGNAMLVRKTAWTQAGAPLFDGALYGWALALLQVQGRKALAHVDTVLVYGTGTLSAQVESREFDACDQVVKAGGLAKRLRPLERLGTWLVEYAASDAACVSLVVPTGVHPGYMRSLLDSLQVFPQAAIAEVVLVCQEQHQDEVEYALSSIASTVPVRTVVLPQGEFSYAQALNAGVAAAASPYILVCDDDTEALHADWLAPMLGIAQQADVGCVAPRLLTHRGTDARVAGGPLVLGINGSAAPYVGESGLLDEWGVHARLQLSQDVSAVAGHCFLFRKADWSGVQGFDEDNFGLWYTVLDFCLRLGQQGKRHVWTPLVSLMHQGGKSADSVMRDTRTKLRMADRDMTERDNLLRIWAQELATDACYNRHLSLFRPFDIENIIVIDWQPRRKDRPRVLACPLTSGAGQYRVVEPLNALQDASLAQTCAIIPHRRRESRVLQPLELVRAAPDRLILQHSVDDAQLGLIKSYRLALPGIKIIQMVDDLLGEVPVKHPNRNFQVREGHQRMARALKQSDRLVVTTDTLKEHYQRYVPDVWRMPNCLDKQWSGLRLPKTPSTGRKLRVGWVGAGQHKGDLELITEVVRELAHEVDWVFMGMSTDAIKPYLKEFHGFVSIGDYPKKMASLNLDIAIAPLEQNFFNECKSNLRLLEYGAMGWPVVCSDVFPYRSDNPPVTRCSDDVGEWLRALRQLMQDEALRLQRGEQLHQWVQQNFLLRNRTRDWMRALFEEETST